MAAAAPGQPGCKSRGARHPAGGVPPASGAGVAAAEAEGKIVTLAELVLLLYEQGRQRAADVTEAKDRQAYLLHACFPSAELRVHLFSGAEAPAFGQGVSAVSSLEW